jgi:hypothetical protein
LDAQATGNLIDDRAKSAVLIEALDALNEKIRLDAEARKAKETSNG